MLLEKELNELANLKPSGFPFTSLYLNTQANEHGRDDFERFVRKEFNEQTKNFEKNSPESKSFKQDRKIINDYLSEKLRSSANGVAIFACAGENNFFEVIELDAPIEEHSMHVSDSPHLFPLARLIDQNPRHIALVADTDEARIFVFDPASPKSVHVVWHADGDVEPTGEMSRVRYPLWLENQRRRHAKNVVEMLGRVVKNEQINHIILAGDEVIIPLLKEQMPQHLSDKLVDVLRLDIRTPENEILKATTKALFDNNIQSDAEKVRDLFDKYQAGGLAVVGLDDTLNALSKGQVDELVLSASLEDISVENEKVLKVPSVSGYANTSVAETENGYPANVADELVSKTLLTKASINFIEDSQLLSDVGGVGAFLRYRENILDSSEIGQT